MIERNNIIQWLQQVEHPAKGDRNIVELGMIEDVEISGNSVTVTLGFAKHRDPLAEYLIGSAKAAILRNAPSGPASRSGQSSRNLHLRRNPDWTWDSKRFHR